MARSSPRRPPAREGGWCYARGMRVVACLLLAGALAGATDLSTVDRKIAKLPKFTAEKQLYGLLVLGPEAASKVWLVADGETLYVDRNANGDLTDDGEPLAARATTDSRGRFRICEWSVGRLARRSPYLVHVAVEYINTSWHPEDPALADPRMEALVKLPDANRSAIRVRRPASRRYFSGSTVFRSSPEDAPVLHMDGPLTLLPTGGLTLKRAEPTDLRVKVGTPAWSRDSPGGFVSLAHEAFPAAARPVIEVEFPGPRPGSYLPVRRFTLDGKC